MRNPRYKNHSIITVQSTLNDRCENENQSRNKWIMSNALRPIYLFLRLYGFMPFTIIYDPNNEIQELRVTVIDILWLLISLCAHTLALFDYLNSDDAPTWQKYSAALIDHVYSISEVIFGVIGIMIDMCNRFKLIDIMKKFNEFDKEVN